MPSVLGKSWTLQTIQCKHNYVSIILCWNILALKYSKRKGKLQNNKIKSGYSWWKMNKGMVCFALLVKIHDWQEITNFSTEFNSHSNLTRIRTFCSKKSSQKQPLYLGHSDSIQTSSLAIKTSNPLKFIFLYQRIFHFLDQHGNSSIVLSALKRVALMTHG